MLEKVGAALGLLRELSWSLTCPAHCGGSVVFPLLAGCAIGFLLGILASFLALLAFWNYLATTSAPATSPGAAAPASSGAHRRTSRLAKYLNEH